MAGNKYLVKKRIIFIPLVVVLCSLGLGGIWLAGRSARQMPTKNPAPLSAKTVIKEQGSASINSIAKANTIIFEVPKQFHSSNTCSGTSK